MPRPSHSFQQQSNSLISDQIKQEIQRFESVHPCIYAIYDIIELIPDPLIAQQIRDHVVCVEDSFVNSQEWTLSQNVPELKLGVVGSLASGKSALVHRYLTGSYMQEESPEGGRFKKEVVIDGQSYLLLIRDEGSAPEEQFSNWVDAVIFVFSLENEDSFKAVYNYYAKMAHYRNTSDVPLILVGTQDSISESNPRVIDESRARKLAHDLKRCGYYETCATYGLNVERVFRDACQKILLQRSGASRNTTPTPSTPSHRERFHYPDHHSTVNMRAHAPSPPNNFNRHVSSRDVTQQTRSYAVSSSQFAVPAAPSVRQGMSPTTSNHSINSMQNNTPLIVHSTPLNDRVDIDLPRTPSTSNRSDPSCRFVNSAFIDPSMERFDNQIPSNPPEVKVPTPSSTPNAQRKHTGGAHRRISNIFRPGHNKNEEKVNGEISLGSGRDIPVKQGNLYKRSSKTTINKEWKKKYVCLYEDGRLSYHSGLKDYMENSTGKSLYLALATVKIPGRQRPRGPRSNTQPITVPPQLRENNGLPVGLSARSNSADKESKVLLTAYEFINEAKPDGTNASGTESESQSSNNIPKSTGVETPNAKVRKRRGHNRAASDVQELEDNLEFIVVTSDQKQWQFEATSADEKDEWVTAIEEQIEKCLQSQLSQKCDSARNRLHGERAQILAIKSLPGNDKCADCGELNPDWASSNVGALICIECSGIHRNLGSHVSRVRSLDLDEWPIECISIMQALGNQAVNSIWEFNTKGRPKPGPSATREMKESWIRAKYEQRTFIASLPNQRSIPQQIMDAVLSKQLQSLTHILAFATEDDVNTTISNRDRRTPLHLACSGNGPEFAQLLLWYNADMTATDQEGRSALWYARQGGSRACFEVLVHAGLTPDYGIPEPGNENIAPVKTKVNLHQNGKIPSYFHDESVI